MRPKVVILILVVAFGLLGMIAVIKSVTSKNADEKGGQAAGTTTNVDVASTGNTTRPVAATSVGNPVVSEQLHAALVAKGIEQIQELQGEIDGSNNATIIQALLDKGSDSEAEVRKAAVEALRNMNDTNAIPGLEKLAASIQDAREKVAVLDAIDYLKLPNIMPDNQPPDTNMDAFAVSKIPEDKMNKEFMQNIAKKPRHKIDRTNSQDAAGTQPQPQPQ